MFLSAKVLMYVGKSAEQSHSMARDVFTWVIVTTAKELNLIVSIFNAYIVSRQRNEILDEV